MKYKSNKKKAETYNRQNKSHDSYNDEIPEFLRERRTGVSESPRDLQKKKVSNKRRRRRKKKYILHYILILIILSATFITLSLTVLFNINDIEITGNGSIDKNEIIELTGVSKGQNLFRINLDKIEDKILKNYITIDKAEVIRSLPDTLSIKLNIAKVDMIVYCKNKYYSISDNGKIIAIDKAMPQSSELKIVGVDISKNELGSYVDKEESALKVIETIKACVDKLSINNITVIDVSDSVSITIYYGESFAIKLGTAEDIEDKIYNAYNLIKNQLSENDKGTIDVSVNNGTYYFRPAEKIDIP